MAHNSLLNTHKWDLKIGNRDTDKKILVVIIDVLVCILPPENNPTCASITASRRGSVSPLASDKTTPPSLCDRIVRILKLKSTSFG